LLQEIFSSGGQENLAEKEKKRKPPPRIRGKIFTVEEEITRRGH